MQRHFLNAATRVLRPHNPPLSRPCSPHCPPRLPPTCPSRSLARYLNHPRSYASIATPPTGADLFDRLFASLRPGMKEDDLALTISTLCLLTEGKGKLDKLEQSLPKYLKGINVDSLNNRVEEYLRNPPQEKIIALTSQLYAAEDGLHDSTIPDNTHLLSIHEINARLAYPDARKIITTLSLDDSAELNKLIKDAEGAPSGAAALAPLLHFLARRSIPFHQIAQENGTVGVATLERVPQKGEYPNLMTPDRLLDPKDVLELPPSPQSPYHNRVTLRNHVSVFEDPNWVERSEDSSSREPSPFQGLIPVTNQFHRNLFQCFLMKRKATQQTGKGKIHRTVFMYLVGDGNGLVGYGHGKHLDMSVARLSSMVNAIKNMDYVERFEKRTIWTEMETKLGATKLILRPRPVGFGLRCNPFLGLVLRAAGFKDISAKVWGSRNKMNVIKAAFRILHAGHAPTGMGDGVGGPGSRLSKGSGLRNKNDLERARGRKLISLRK